MERTTTWQGIGQDVSQAEKIEEVLESANLNFTVEKTPLIVDYQGAKVEVPNRSVTVRSDIKEALGVVSSDYAICQNADAFDFVNYVSGDLKFEKAGMTHHGMVYIIAALPEVKVLSDSFTPHLIFQNSFNGLYPVKVAIAPLRIVCQNQMSIAFVDASNTITLRHSNQLEYKLTAAKATFLETANYMQEFTKQAEKLATKKFSVEQFNCFVYDCLPINADMTDLQKERIMTARQKIYDAYMNDDNTNFRGTAWGAINGLSDWLTHKEPSRNTSKIAENQFMAVTFKPVMLQQLFERVAA